MFTLTDRVMLVDLSNFSLGATITIYEGGRIMLHHSIPDVSEVEDKAIEIADEMEVKNIFIRPLATSNGTKTLEDFENSLASKNFSKSVDKINFHML